MHVCLSKWILLCCLRLHLCDAYRHIIFMHGLFGHSSNFNLFESYLSKVHPNTTVTKIPLFEGLSSLTTPLWKQSDNILVVMDSVMKQHPEGVHLLCYSQGGLVCRAIIERLPSHNVVSFISLSAPQAGQFGYINNTSTLPRWLPALASILAYKIFYSKDAQDHLSLANYWNDPYRSDMYDKYSNFLAVLNNESSAHQDHQYSPEWKENFRRVKNLVLIGGPDDGLITPWQSSHFGFYIGDTMHLTDMTRHKWYQEDSFGLKSLDQAGKVHLYTVPGVAHEHWLRNLTVFYKCILRWLD